MMLSGNDIMRKVCQLKIFKWLLNIFQRNSSIKIKEFQDEYKYELTYQPQNATYSGHYLKIIPSDSNYKPSKQQQFDAIQQLISLFNNNEIQSIITNNIEFIDQGENISTVSCNKCGALMDEEYWSDVVTNAQLNSFEDLTFKTPCCSQTTNLNELKYDMPAGFSKYQLIVSDPKFEDYYRNEHIIKIQDIFGVKLRLIWCHY